MREQFFTTLEQLVALAEDFPTQEFDEAAPEEVTKNRLLRPFLRALGYSEEQVVPEYRIIGDEVDYLLRTTRPLLFIEAKSLIDTAPNLFDAHREQVLRYIRNYRVSPQQAEMERPVAWILLTSFAQFHFIRVNEDAPSFSFRLNELLARHDELWELLAPENLEAGRIDELYDQQQKAPLDQRFLADLKRWRLLLANGFALRNQSRPLADLTLASQQLLDRFLFCRMLETHRLVEHNKLARAFVHYEALYGEADQEKTFAEVLKETLFAEIKRDFNTELFVQPLLCDELRMDNLFVATAIGHEPLHSEIAAQCGLEAGQGQLLPFKHLYGYDFSRMSQDVMGAVYERFLAHKLLQDGGRIVIEDTDELRKREGIYYTPQYIVDYLVVHTLGDKVKPVLGEALALLGYGKFPAAHAKIRELQRLKVLDPAMGSGSFLLRAFDALIRAYGEYNEACRRAKAERRNGSGMLFDAPADIAEEVTDAPLHVLTENIFGVDLDAQAVEVAKLSLWLRYMALNRESFRDRLRSRSRRGKPLNLLPTLTRNLKRGDSLIDDPTVAGDAAFPWQKEFPQVMEAGGFDAVIGNPPYILLQDEFADDKQVAFFRAHFKVASYKIDTYHLFIERGLCLARPGGLCGMITPANFLTNNYLAGLRRFLIEHAKIEQIVVVDEGVFGGISVDNAVFVVRSGQTTTASFPVLHGRPDGAVLQVKARNLISAPAALADEHVLFTGEASSGLSSLLARVRQSSIPLGKIADVNFGKQLRDREKFEKDVITVPATGKVPSGYKPCFTGEDITRYHVAWGSLACLDTEEARCGGCWDGAKQNAKNKLLTRQIGTYPQFGPDPFGYHCLNTIFMVNVREEACDPRLLLGILNSTLLRTYWLNRFYDQRRTFPKIKGTYLGELPVKLPKTPAEGAASKRIVELVDQMVVGETRFHTIPHLLHKKVAHTSERTPCSLAHYLQKDFAAVLKHEILLNDVQRVGFIHAIMVESEGKQVTVSATVADDGQAARARCQSCGWSSRMPHCASLSMPAGGASWRNTPVRRNGPKARSRSRFIPWWSTWWSRWSISPPARGTTCA